MPRVCGFAVSGAPPNGTAFVGLLVGGNVDVLKSLRSDLYDEFGIEIRNQWESLREFCNTPPRETDVILVLTDFCAHQMSRDAVKLAKSSRLRYALIGRKKSAWLNGLNLSGFTHRPSWLKPRPPVAGPRKEIIMQRVETKPIARPNGVNVAAAPAPGVTAVTPPPALAPVPKVDTSAVYVPKPRRWSEADMQCVVSLAEKWRASNPPDSWADDGERFVIDSWIAVGSYRTPAALQLRLNAFRIMAKIPPELLGALGRAHGRVRRAKERFMRLEHAELKRPRAEWPEWISGDAATDIVGGKARMPRDPMVHRPSGVLVYRRTDIAEIVTRHETRGMTRTFRGSGLTPLEWERRILDRLKANGGPCARNAFGFHRYNERGEQALRELVKSGAVLEDMFRGATFFRLPEQSWPPPFRLPPRKVAAPRKLPPLSPEMIEEIRDRIVNPRAPGPRPQLPRLPADLIAEIRDRMQPQPEPEPKPEPGPVPAPDGGARAEILRMMRAGEITKREAAELLLALVSS